MTFRSIHVAVVRAVVLAALVILVWMVSASVRADDVFPVHSPPPLTPGQNISIAFALLSIATVAGQIIANLIKHRMDAAERDAVGRATRDRDLALARSEAAEKDAAEERMARQIADKSVEYWRGKYERLSVQYASRTGEPPKSSSDIPVPKS